MSKFSLIVICLSVLLLFACKRNNTNDSAQFHADASNSGFYSTEGVKHLHGVKWSFSTDGRVFSSPIIFKDKVLVGSDDSCLYALKVKDGSLLWKFKSGGMIRSTPVIYNNKAFIFSYDGYLYCLGLYSGKEIWKFKTAGERAFAAPGIHGLPEKNRLLDDPWDMYASSPVIANGNIYFGCGEGVFYAIDCNSGRKIWEYVTNGVIHSSPAYSDSTVFFGSWDSYLYALDAANGTLKWRFKTGIDTVYYNQVGFQSSPVVYKGVVYSGCRDSYIRANDAKTGDLRWKCFNNGSWIVVTPAVHNDTLYYTTSDTHKFIALNITDGSMLYSGDCKSFGFSSPAITQGTVYLGNFGGSLLAFRSDNGEQLWEFKTKAATLNKDSILLNNGEFNASKVFKENSYSGMLKAVDMLYSVGSILSSPAVADGVIYFGSTDGNVYALN
jgi:eukaryotic-like serine/threonine-protein kinase